MSGQQAPVLWARTGVTLAARVLPTTADRARYRAEYLAELCGLPSSAQLRHTAGVLSQTFALRAALGDAHPNKEEEMLTTTTRWRRLRCRYLRWHDWQTFSNPDGERYTAWSVCGREEISQPPGGVAGAWRAG